MVAGYMAVSYSLSFFRYRGDSMDYYTLGDQFMGTERNLWKMANHVRYPACISIFGLLFVLQALSMAGVAVEINMMAWMYLLPVWVLSNYVAHAIQFVGYERSGSWYMEAPDSYPNWNGVALMTKMGSEIYQHLAYETSALTTLYFAMSSWFYGQYSMLPDDEAKERWMKQGGKDRSEKHMLVRLHDL